MTEDFEVNTRRSHKAMDDKDLRIARLEAALEQAQAEDDQARKDLFESIDEGIKQHNRIEKLEAALKPFSHDHLCEYLGGNANGEQSIIFQRNKAKLTIGDCRLARDALGEMGNDND